LATARPAFNCVGHYRPKPDSTLTIQVRVPIGLAATATAERIIFSEPHLLIGAVCQVSHPSTSMKQVGTAFGALVVLAAIDYFSVAALQFRHDQLLFDALRRQDLARARELIQHGERWKPLLTRISRAPNRRELATRALQVSLMWWYEAKTDSNICLAEDPSLLAALLALGAEPSAEELYLAASQDKRLTTRRRWRVVLFQTNRKQLGKRR